MMKGGMANMMKQAQQMQDNMKKAQEALGQVDVEGSAGAGAGSAQMVGMCRQMVDGRMTFEQASAFAESNGYSARIGSIDGESLPVTADYRPDRFTLALVNGLVVSCKAVAPPL